MPPKFFITHSWKDIDFARHLADDLRANGLDGFFDMYVIQPGDNIALRISQGLEECDVFIPILSPAAVKSKWCELEINAAINLSNEPERRGRPRIMPIVVQECRLPTLLRGRLYINFVGRYDDALRELVTKGFGASPKIQEPSRVTLPPPPPPPPPPKKEKLFLTHSHEDNSFAKRFYADISKRGIESFFDLVSVRRGDNLAEKIDEGLQSCTVYVPILSHATLKSKWCKREVFAAINLNNNSRDEEKPRIIPVLIEDCVSSMPVLLRVYLYVVFENRYNEALEEFLVEGLGLSPSIGRK